MSMVEQSDVRPEPVNHVVITVHGIRTFGQWQERLGRLLRGRPGMHLAHYQYGYFSMIAFLIPILRWLVTRRFRAEVLRLASKHPGARVDIVAHSFGTHLVGHGLAGIPQGQRPKVHTIILAGSVLKVGFPWRVLMDDDTVHRVINDCGIEDNVLVLNQFVVLFTGMAGRVGFVGMTDPERFVNRYFNFGHSGYFENSRNADDEFLRKWWIPLLTGPDPPEPADERVGGSALTGLQVFLLNNLEPVKLTIYMTPLVFLGLVYYWLYRGELIAREQRDQQYVSSQRNLRESLILEAQALRQTTLSDRRERAASALSRAAVLDVGGRDEVAELKLRSEYLRSLDIIGMLPGPRHPDARYPLILGSSGRTVAIPEEGSPGEFHPESGKLLRSFPGLGQVRPPAALDPGGKRLAFRSPDASHLAVWDTDQGRMVTRSR